VLAPNTFKVAENYVISQKNFLKERKNKFKPLDIALIP
jgi:DNA-directed RNA polymerase specialized sigma54-like protein